MGDNRQMKLKSHGGEDFGRRRKSPEE